MQVVELFLVTEQLLVIIETLLELMPVTEQWIVNDKMVDDVKKLRSLRKNKLAAFTRKQKHLSGLLETETDSNKLNEVFNELKAALGILEEVHDKYSAEEEENVIEAEGDYLEVPSQALVELDAKVASQVKKLEVERNREAFQNHWDQSLAKFKNNIDTFGSPSKFLAELCTAGSISFSDMRSELSKIEDSFQKLSQEKVDLFNLDSSFDTKEIVELFNLRVASEFERCKATGLAYMKDEVSTPVVSTGGGGETVVPAGSSYSTTKRETVMLPHFSGDEKTAFLKYPV